MRGLKEEDHGECSQTFYNLQSYQDQLLLLQHQQQQQMQQNSGIYGGGGGGSRGGLIFPPEVSPIFPWPQLHDPFLVPPPPPPPPPPPQTSSYGSLMINRRAPALQFAYEGSPFGLQGELGKMSAQEIMDAKALAASKSHSEAERRRRERINNHLAKLRSLLPSATKTDKASLLAEVIQHVKELKRQTTLIAETSPVPTEIDELTVDASDEDGKFVIKASLCCEDRSDLLPELIKTLKSLRLRTLKAEITTLGGRVKNVLFITGEEDSSDGGGEQISSIQEALKAVMKTGGDEASSGSLKRQRTNMNMAEHSSL